MKKALSDPFAILSIAVLLFLLLQGGWQLLDQSGQAGLRQAQADYMAAVNTGQQNVRQDKFNAALNELQSLEEQYDPAMGNGKLYSNIGTIFYQLHEYPMALLYYYRAQGLRPRDEKLRLNVAMALQKANLPPAAEKMPLQRLFFFHYDFSIPERLQLFALFFTVSLALAAGAIWLHRSWMEKLSTLMLLLAGVFLLSLGWSYFFTPATGVLLTSTPLFRGPGLQYAKVNEEPEIAGSQVHVQEAVQNGRWIKVQTADGSIGYISAEGIRQIGN